MPVQSRRKTSDADAGNEGAQKSKSAQKNERRKERKRQAAARMRSESIASVASAHSVGDGAAFSTLDEDEDLSRALALSSLDAPHLTVVSDHPHDTHDVYDIHGPYDPAADPRSKRLRKLRKKLASVDSLLSRPVEDLDEHQRAKIGKADEVRKEASALEGQLEDEEREREERERRRREWEEERQRQRLREWSDLEDGRVVEGFGLGTGVQGGDTASGPPDEDADEFACPLCFGPLETPVSAHPCSHVFCRACLEDAVHAAAQRSRGDPESCVCPLCRASLYDPRNEKVRADPAENVKRKMRKRRCTCRCGAEVSLSGLREHLRGCGRGAPTLFADDQKKKFGHEAFEQPQLDPIKVARLRKEYRKGKGKNKTGREDRSGSSEGSRGQSQGRSTGANAQHAVPAEYSEEAEIQAAILRSLEET